MNISSVTSTYTAAGSQAGVNPVARDWKSLQSAMSQGNLGDASTAFSSLEKDLAKSPGGTPSPNSAIGQALTQMQTALEKGSVPDAQSAYSELRSAVRGHRPSAASSAYQATTTSNTSEDSQPTTSSDGTTGTILNVLA